MSLGGTLKEDIELYVAMGMPRDRAVKTVKEEYAKRQQQYVQSTKDLEKRRWNGEPKTY